MTMQERCFICGTAIGPNNQTFIGIQERTNKLVSVSQTVEHSSTIISDILSRILNETVMNEETICKICFNLLNDVDYHLKEAQEKTDEITNKFLDKGKDPLSYKPQPIVTAQVSKNPNQDQIDDNVPSTSPKQPKRKSRKRHSIPLEQDPTLTEDEMSVNIINKNKAKLLSHVLNPRMKSKSDRSRNVSERDDDLIEPYVPSDPVVPLSSVNHEQHQVKSKKKKKLKRKHSEREETLDHHQSVVEEDYINSNTTANLILESPQEKFSTTYYSKKSCPNDQTDQNKDPMDPHQNDCGPIGCQYCKKTFKKRSNLLLHEERVHSAEHNLTKAVVSIKVEPETHKCNLCPREFTNMNSLENHKENEHKNTITIIHTKKDPIVGKPKSDEIKAVCPQCNKTFRRQFNMRIHVERVHEKKRPFGCNICSKSFATNSDLKQHMNVHGAGKVFQCDFEGCGRSFTNRDSIILHRKQHANQKTHFCTICNKGFYKSSCLSRHMRTHTGEKPYICEHCGKGFSQSTTLKNHISKCTVIQ